MQMQYETPTGHAKKYPIKNLLFFSKSTSRYHAKFFTLISDYPIICTQVC